MPGHKKRPVGGKNSLPGAEPDFVFRAKYDIPAFAEMSRGKMYKALTTTCPLHAVWEMIYRIHNHALMRAEPIKSL